MAVEDGHPDHPYQRWADAGRVPTPTSVVIAERPCVEAYPGSCVAFTVGGQPIIYFDPGSIPWLTPRREFWARGRAHLGLWAADSRPQRAVRLGLRLLRDGGTNTGARMGGPVADLPEDTAWCLPVAPDSLAAPLVNIDDLLRRQRPLKNGNVSHLPIEISRRCEIPRREAKVAR